MAAVACAGSEDAAVAPASPAPSAVKVARDPYALGVPRSGDLPAPPADTPPHATLQGIAVYGHSPHVVGGAAQVRVVLTFDQAPVFRRTEQPATSELPRRVALDLDGVQLGDLSTAPLAVGAGGVRHVRTLPLPDEQLRVAFDVEADAGYRLFHLTHPYRLILDFRRAERRVQANAAWTVVLDPGHGGAQDGASGPNGLEESVVALSLALRTRKALARKAPGMRVVLTREGDRTVTLEERSALANAIDADMFVSIHLNASPSPTDRGGVSTYVLDTSDDIQALRLAARENGAEVQDVTGMQKLFASLYRKDQVAHSLELAQAIQTSTLSGGRKILPALEDRGVKKAMFYVLVGTTMPAVLCEASFITRPEEAEALATDAYRDALAEGMADGIVAYARSADRARKAAGR
jgi:N-acetylmuramoyl-L-alanine amidase